MALTAALEELLKTLPADVQVQQRAILEKHPTLGEGWLRQSDYDRYMNDNKTKVAKYDETIDWWKRTKPVHDQGMQDLAEAQREVERLKAEVATKAAEAAAAAAASGEGGVDAGKIADAVMSKLGATIPTKTELAQLISAESEKQANAHRDKFFKEDVPATLNFMTAMNDVQFRYRDEFGKAMNRVEFAKFMTDNKLNDPLDAYEKYTEKDRREHEVNAEVEKRTKAEFEKAGFVPGSTNSKGNGHLQTRIAEKKTGDPLFGQDVELGDNAAAMAAAAELRNEGRV